MAFGILIELSPQEVAALLHIADGRQDSDPSEDDLILLQTRALIEQRGASFGLTAAGIRAVARLRSR